MHDLSSLPEYCCHVPYSIVALPRKRIGFYISVVAGTPSDAFVQHAVLETRESSGSFILVRSIRGDIFSILGSTWPSTTSDRVAQRQLKGIVADGASRGVCRKATPIVQNAKREISKHIARFTRSFKSRLEWSHGRENRARRQNDNKTTTTREGRGPQKRP